MAGPGASSVSRSLHLAEIAIPNDIAARIALPSFRGDPIMCRAAVHAIQTISEAVRLIPKDWLADFPTEPWTYPSRMLRIDDAIFIKDHDDRRASL
jgi:uncharacterized protein with HEPN domain